jgi:PAS domain S-box-containing protein
VDAGRRVTGWSPGAAATFRYSEGEALGMLADELFTPEDRVAGAPQQEAEQARRTGRAPDERWHLRKDGSRVFVRGSVRPLHDPDGRLTGYLKIARDETREREFLDALKRSEADLRAMADSMPVLVFVADGEGRNTYVNLRYQEFTGKPAEALMGEGWAEAVHPDDLPGLVERAREARETRRPLEMELRLRAGSGDYRWFLVRATPAGEADGVVRRWFGACSDVDEQRRAQDRQVLLNQEISHRVKNSLQLVSGFLGLQARRAADDARPLIEEAASRVRAIAQVHDQLWRQSAVDTVHLAPFLTDLCESLARGAPRCATTCSFEPASVPVDSAAPIGLVVNEVLTNAYKYAGSAGGEAAVEVRGTREDGRYRIEVRDRGPGLPAEFDLARPGESLGLRVMTALAGQIGAELRAENADPGARFTLVAPLSSKGESGR